ncbi:hypothetical protein HAX54_039798 [Datura stramonium]|uniref:Uncharacterized protein n=1 Tax=Datura stramonium TaxID=4076 RepID=A0ABS8SJS5_DATST|nr:hypothetical protein [Datura stramonium]
MLPNSTFAAARWNDSFNLAISNQDTLICRMNLQIIIFKPRLRSRFSVDFISGDRGRRTLHKMRNGCSSFSAPSFSTYVAAAEKRIGLKFGMGDPQEAQQTLEIAETNVKKAEGRSDATASSVLLEKKINILLM